MPSPFGAPLVAQPFFMYQPQGPRAMFSSLPLMDPYRPFPPPFRASFPRPSPPPFPPPSSAPIRPLPKATGGPLVTTETPMDPLEAQPMPKGIVEAASSFSSRDPRIAPSGSGALPVTPFANGVF